MTGRIREAVRSPLPVRLDPAIAGQSKLGTARRDREARVGTSY